MYIFFLTLKGYKILHFNGISTDIFCYLHVALMSTIDILHLTVLKSPVLNIHIIILLNFLASLLWAFFLRRQHWLSSIPAESIMSPLTLIYVFFFWLVAVIDKAIWRCLALHHLRGCQWRGIKILYIGLIFQKFFFFLYHMTFTLCLSVKLPLSRSAFSSPHLFPACVLYVRNCHLRDHRACIHCLCYCYRATFNCH